jgi:hypothetical protein
MEVVCGSEKFTADGTPMSKGTWDIGVVNVIKWNKRAIKLTVGRKCRKHWSGRSQIIYELADSFQFLHSNCWECQ